MKVVQLKTCALLSHSSTVLLAWLFKFPSETERKVSKSHEKWSYCGEEGHAHKAQCPLGLSVQLEFMLMWHTKYLDS